ncbi:MAG: ATP phosphoribosyltransferase, partial [Lentisphaeria bacterium]
RLALLLKAVLAAETKVGLMLNVHKDNLERVLAILPALQRPTVAHLSDPDWYSLTTVIDQHVARDIIPELMAVGGEGLVEYSLNKVVI